MQWTKGASRKILPICKPQQVMEANRPRIALPCTQRENSCDLKMLYLTVYDQSTLYEIFKKLFLKGTHTYTHTHKCDKFLIAFSSLRCTVCSTNCQLQSLSQWLRPVIPGILNAGLKSSSQPMLQSEFKGSLHNLVRPACKEEKEDWGYSSGILICLACVKP